jgi:hypothetical protein
LLSGGIDRVIAGAPNHPRSRSRAAKTVFVSSSQRMHSSGFTSIPASAEAISDAGTHATT